jgi:hypothetical protein
LAQLRSLKNLKCKSGEVKKGNATAKAETPIEQVAKEPKDAKKPIKKTKVVTFKEKPDNQIASATLKAEKPTTKLPSKRKGENKPIKKSFKKSSATVAHSTRSSTCLLNGTAPSQGMF